MSSKWDSMFVDMAELGVNVDIETMPAQGEWGNFEKLLKDMGGPVQMETIDVPEIDPSIPDDQLDAPMFRAKRDGTLPLAAPEEFAVPIDLKYEDGSKPKGDKSKDLLGQYGYKPIGVNYWDRDRKLAYASRLPYAAVSPDAMDISQGPISTSGEFGRAAHAMGVPGTAESPVMRDKGGNVLMQKSALDVEIEGYSIPPSEGPMVEGTKLPLPGYAYYDDQTARQQMNELATGRPSLAYYRDVETAMERYEKYPTSENRLKLESELKAWRDRQNAINREVRSMEATGEERSPQDHVAEFVAANTPTLDPSTEGGNWFGGTTMGRLRAAPLEGLANFLETTVSAMALDGGQARAETFMNQQVRARVANARDEMTASPFWTNSTRLALESMGQQMPIYLAAYLGAPAAVTYGAIGAQAGWMDYNATMAKTNDKALSLLHATGVGLIESGTEIVGGKALEGLTGIKPLEKAFRVGQKIGTKSGIGWLQRNSVKMAQLSDVIMKSNLGRAAAELLGNAGSEFGEEATAGIAGGFWDAITGVDPQALDNMSIEDIAYQGWIGALSGGVMAMPRAILIAFGVIPPPQNPLNLPPPSQSPTPPTSPPTMPIDGTGPPIGPVQRRAGTRITATPVTGQMPSEVFPSPEEQDAIYRQQTVEALQQALDTEARQQDPWREWLTKDDPYRSQDELNASRIAAKLGYSPEEFMSFVANQRPESTDDWAQMMIQMQSLARDRRRARTEAMVWNAVTGENVPVDAGVPFSTGLAQGPYTQETVAASGQGPYTQGTADGSQAPYMQETVGGPVAEPEARDVAPDVTAPTKASPATRKALQRQGFRNPEINEMSADEASDILTEGMTAKEWREANPGRARQSYKERQAAPEAPSEPVTGEVAYDDVEGFDQPVTQAQPQRRQEAPRLEYPELEPMPKLQPGEPGADPIPWGVPYDEQGRAKPIEVPPRAPAAPEVELYQGHPAEATTGPDGRPLPEGWTWRDFALQLDELGLGSYEDWSASQGPAEGEAAGEAPVADAGAIPDIKSEEWLGVDWDTKNQWVAAITTERAKGSKLEGALVPWSDGSMVTWIGWKRMARVRIKGQIIPFYVSDGTGGKANVKKNQWYPFWGITPTASGYVEWINKLDEDSINDYYGVKELKEAAEELGRLYPGDETWGPEPNPKRPLATVHDHDGLDFQFIADINRDLGLDPYGTGKHVGYREGEVVKANIREMKARFAAYDAQQEAQPAEPPKRRAGKVGTVNPRPAPASPANPSFEDLAGRVVSFVTDGDSTPRTGVVDKVVDNKSGLVAFVTGDDARLYFVSPEDLRDVGEEVPYAYTLPEISGRYEDSDPALIQEDVATIWSALDGEGRKRMAMLLRRNTGLRVTSAWKPQTVGKAVAELAVGMRQAAGRAAAVVRYMQENIDRTNPESPEFSEDEQRKALDVIDEMLPGIGSAPRAAIATAESVTEVREQLLNTKQFTAEELDAALAKLEIEGDKRRAGKKETAASPANPPFMFFSGLQSAPGDMEEVRKRGGAVGVALSRPISDTVRNQMLLQARNGGSVFIDSGAFTSWTKGAGMDWERIFQWYAEFIDELTPAQRANVYFVMPDAVGNQEATRNLQTRFEAEINELASEGVNVIMPIQRGNDVDLMAELSLLTNLVDFGNGNVVIGIPYNAQAWTLPELEEFVTRHKAAMDADATEADAMGAEPPKPLRLHLLGGGRTATARAYDALSKIDPTIRVTGDASTFVRNRRNRPGKKYVKTPPPKPTLERLTAAAPEDAITAQQQGDPEQLIDWLGENVPGESLNTALDLPSDATWEQTKARLGELLATETPPEKPKQTRKRTPLRDMLKQAFPGIPSGQTARAEQMLNEYRELGGEGNEMDPDFWEYKGKGSTLKPKGLDQLRRQSNRESARSKRSIPTPETTITTSRVRRPLTILQALVSRGPKQTEKGQSNHTARLMIAEPDVTVEEVQALVGPEWKVTKLEPSELGERFQVRYGFVDPQAIEDSIGYLTRGDAILTNEPDTHVRLVPESAAKVEMPDVTVDEATTKAMLDLLDMLDKARDIGEAGAMAVGGKSSDGGKYPPELRKMAANLVKSFIFQNQDKASFELFNAWAKSLWTTAGREASGYADVEPLFKLTYDMASSMLGVGKKPAKTEAKEEPKKAEEPAKAPSKPASKPAATTKTEATEKPATPEKAAELPPAPKAAAKPKETLEQRLLRLAKITVTPGQWRTAADGRDAWAVQFQKRRYSGHDLVLLFHNLGGEFDVKTKAFIFRQDPSESIAKELARPSEGRGLLEDSDAGEAGDRDVGLEDLAREGVRREWSRAPGRRASSEVASSKLSADTVSILRQGGGVMQAEVLDNQQEDAGHIIIGYENSSAERHSAFVLAAAPGQGKTFTIGAALRELLPKIPKGSQVVFVTQSAGLVEQAKNNLRLFLGDRVNEINFISYAKLRHAEFKKPVEIVIFDEGHNIKNEGSQQGFRGQDLMQQARYTIVSTATPFENPVQAFYLKHSGIFDDIEVEVPRVDSSGENYSEKVTGYEAWAWAYGAGLQRKPLDERMAAYWPGRYDGKPYMVDGEIMQPIDPTPLVIGANDWLEKTGVFSYRPSTFPAGLVDSTNVMVTEESAFAPYAKAVLDAYVDVMHALSGLPKRTMMAYMLPNMRKRLLEMRKIEAAIERAKEHLSQGRQVAVFMENKSDLTVGYFARSQAYLESPSAKNMSSAEKAKRFDPDAIDEMMRRYLLENAQSERGPKNPAPFSYAVWAVALELRDRGLVRTVPDITKQFTDALRDHRGWKEGTTARVVEYTGNMTEAEATKNYEAWMAGKADVIIATFAKGGTGLSYHDTTGTMPERTQIVVNLPWVATGVEQASGRLARQGIQKKTHIEWLFAKDDPDEIALGRKVGNRMRAMSAIVRGAVSDQGNQIAEGTLEQAEQEGWFEPEKVIPMLPVVEPPPHLEEQTRPAADLIEDANTPVEGNAPVDQPAPPEPKAEPKVEPKAAEPEKRRVGKKPEPKQESAKQEPKTPTIRDMKKRKVGPIERKEAPDGRLPVIEPEAMVLGRTTPIHGEKPHQRTTGRFGLIRLPRLIASHDYSQGHTQKNPLYPTKVNAKGDPQTRNYDPGAENDIKVHHHANADNETEWWTHFISEVSSATTGAPTITPEGVVLNGNGRTMILQLIYNVLSYGGRAKFALYQKYLRERLNLYFPENTAEAQAFLDANDDVMLVRLVDMDYNSEEAREFAIWGNEPTTQQMSVDEAVRAGGSIIGIEDVIEQMKLTEDDDINSILNEPRGHLLRQELKRRLSSNLTALLFVPNSEEHKLTDAGKDFVVKLLYNQVMSPEVGPMLKDKRPGLFNTLTSALPRMILLNRDYPGFDLMAKLEKPIRWILESNIEKTAAEAEATMNGVGQLYPTWPQNLMLDADELMLFEFLHKYGDKRAQFRNKLAELLKHLNSKADDLFDNDTLDPVEIIAEILDVPRQPGASFGTKPITDEATDIEDADAYVTMSENTRYQSGVKAQKKAQRAKEGRKKMRDIRDSEYAHRPKPLKSWLTPDKEGGLLAWFKGLYLTFFPEYTEEGGIGKDIVIEEAARVNQAGTAEFNALNKVWTGHSKLSPKHWFGSIRLRFAMLSRQEVVDFIHKIETGRIQDIADEQLRRVAEIIREGMDALREEVRALGEGHLEEFIVNYFPHIWQRAHQDSARAAMQRWAGQGLQGSKSFLKQRSEDLEFFIDGLREGLEPVSWNPIDLYMAKSAEMRRFLMARRIMQRQRDLGKLVFVPWIGNQQHVPAGYKIVKDAAYHVFAPPWEEVKEMHDKGLMEGLMQWLKDNNYQFQRVFKIPEKRGAWGYATDRTRGVVTAWGSIDAVAVHEVGHLLDYHWGLWRYMTATSNGRQIIQQIKAMARTRNAPHGYRMKREELAAILLEAYIAAPKFMQENAPDAYQRFEEFLGSDARLAPLKDVKPTLTYDVTKGKMPISGMREIGVFAMPEDMAHVMNNFLSDSIFSRAHDYQTLAAPARLWRAFKGIMNQTQLVSGFHATVIAASAAMTPAGDAIRLGLEAARLGDADLAKFAAKEVFVGFPNTIREGRKMLKAFRMNVKDITDPVLLEKVQRLIQAGARSESDRMHMINMRERLHTRWEKIKNERKWQAQRRDEGFDAPAPWIGFEVDQSIRLLGETFLAAIETVMSPLFEEFIPIIKLGMASRAIEMEDMRLKKNQYYQALPLEEKRQVMVRAAQKAWEDSEDRFGQLTYDNLFMQKWVKDMAHIMVRAPGWNYGFFRGYVVGPAIDTVRTGRRLGKSAWNRDMSAFGADSIMSRRQAEVIATFAMWSLWGSIANFLLTGEWPEDVYDRFFPRNGKVRPDGSPERMVLPGYMKDYFSWFLSPFTTASHKLAPPLSTVGTLWSGAFGDNQDYFGNQIARWEEGVARGMLDLLVEVAQDPLPFSMRDFDEKRKDGWGFFTALGAAAAGISVASKTIGRSPAMKLMKSLQAEAAKRGNAKPRTKAEQEAAEMRSDIVDMMRQGKDWRTEKTDYKKYFDRSDIDRMEKQAKLHPFQYLYDRLDTTDATRVFEIATESERDMIANQLVRKAISRQGGSEKDALNREMIYEYLSDNWDAIKGRLTPEMEPIFYEAARIAYGDLQHPRAPKSDAPPEEVARYEERVADYRMWQATVREFLKQHWGEPEVWSQKMIDYVESL